MMEKLPGTLAVLFDYASAMTPSGVMGGIVLVVGFVILAVGIDRVRTKIDELTSDVNDLSRKIDSLTLVIEGQGGAHLDVRIPVVEARASEASLAEIRKRLEALSTEPDRKIDAERH
jgi:hypothetical protein